MFCFWIIWTGYAQNSVKVDYIQLENEELTGIREVMNIAQLIFEVRGDFTGKKMQLFENRIKGDSIQKQMVYETQPLTDTLLHFCITARQPVTDSVSIYMQCRNTYYRWFNYHIDHCKHYILMETSLKKSLDEDIPVFAYTEGIKKTIKYNGEMVEAIDYCGLRFSNVSPEQWFKQFRIDNFIYFTLNFR